jgi:hypothetical protein
MNSRLLILGALLASAPAWSLDLKGVEVGQPINAAQVKDALGFHFNTGMESQGERCVASCGWGETSIAGASAQVAITIDHHVLAEISATFPSLDFDKISAAILTKYGKPVQLSHSHAQTVAGAQLNVIIETWRDAAGDELVLSNFADGATGALTLTSKTEVDGKAARAKKRAGDI